MLNPAEREKTKEMLKSENIDMHFDSFALKILLQQLSVWYRLEKSDRILEEAVGRVENFFEKMKSLNTVKKDFEKLYRRRLDA